MTPPMAPGGAAGTVPDEGVLFTMDPASEPGEAAVAAARRLVKALLHAENLAPAEASGIADRLNQIASDVEDCIPDTGGQERTWQTRTREDSALRNPVNGRQNALAPGLTVRGLPDGSVSADVSLDILYEGPPSFVHGGVSALLLDHLFGAANYWAGTVGPTAELTLRYKRPVPLETPLTLTAKQRSQDGRKLWTTGAIEANGKVCVEAEGLFIAKPEFGYQK